MLDSKNIPDIPFKLTSGHMNELFRNFTLNWSTLSPVLTLLFGTLFGLFLITLLVIKFRD